MVYGYSIRTVPSIHILDLTRKQAQRIKGLAKEILIVGNPTMPKVTELTGESPVQLSPIPYATKEAQDIAAIFTNFLQTAPTAVGIYSKHLQRQEYILQQQPELGKAMQEIITNDYPVILTTEIRFKLYSLGLVKLGNDEVTPRCELYRQYFRTSIPDT